MSCNCPKIYAERDIIGQGEYYPKHVCHMTYEGLHDKSAIAAELAHRDIEIDDIKATITALEAVLKPFVDAYVRADNKESWAASYLNNSAWERAYKALLKQEQES